MPTHEPVQVARELYALVPAEFVAARNARATGLRQARQRELAAQVKGLLKASVAAWAVTAVVREAGEDVDALGELGAELRVAQRLANPAELRALSRRRRELVAALTRTAARVAADHDVELSAAAREQVADTWQAVVIDPTAERAARSGLLVRALEPGDADPRAALALPGAVEGPDAPVADDGLRLVRGLPGPDEGEDVAAGVGSADDPARKTRRLRRELQARERALAGAREELDEASEELARVEAQVLQAAARLEELRRQALQVEQRLDGLDEARVAAAEEREDAQERAREAQEQVVQVRDRLAELAEE